MSVATMAGLADVDRVGPEILNAFTVDVEDYFQVSAFENRVLREHWDLYESRVVANTRRILALLERHQVRATFFVLGWVAHRFPQLVREIRRFGHEIGSHGYWHRLIYDQSPEQFRNDLKQSREILEDLVGERILAYRAPSFSITSRSLWALEILLEEGFGVDSSVFPVRHDRYGIPEAEPRIHRVNTPSGVLWEFPPSVVQWHRLNVPVSGGGYFRLYPLAWTLRWLASINHGCQQPFMFYVHPWELDPQQPRLRAGNFASRIRHRLNLPRTESRLERLLGAFRFGPVHDVLCERGLIENANTGAPTTAGHETGKNLSNSGIPTVP
jgi:polysaccharide deacetylase family protein (PEP-CTERM system associated)